MKHTPTKIEKLMLYVSIFLFTLIMAPIFISFIIIVIGFCYQSPLLTILLILFGYAVYDSFKEKGPK